MDKVGHFGLAAYIYLDDSPGACQIRLSQYRFAKLRGSMKPRHRPPSYTVLSRCPDCAADTSFDSQGHGNSTMGTSIIGGPHMYAGVPYTRVLWKALRCSVCNRGGIAKFHDRGTEQTAVLEDFFPRAIEQATLPIAVPEDIAKEFREAELDASNGAFRSASAMLRSVLEKTLKKNGYQVVEVRDGDGNVALDKNGNPRNSNRLIDRIDAAAWDKVITETRQKRAHENIRVLGNDILHDDWREVAADEFSDAHKYAQRILEDFYDDRSTVEARLAAQKRPYVPDVLASDKPTSTS